ncbi:hypothetical protein [Bacillus sp. SJS]|uniref:hypothetical protein n=1 Tax=Bacillus sp. SJS TaxID=1423321 RepID=UPI0004DD85AB|nr:hypothetical protein [Bacillus sp. SJS]KZZ84411.1 hypothetical protein AS29_011190 [Bacillus sp. SJS]
MRKKLFLLILISVIAFGGVYLFVKFNPPLEIGTLASSEDKKSIVVEVGNKGFWEVKIGDVLINNNEKPTKLKVQASNSLQGFIITDDFNNKESKNYRFMNIHDVTLKAGTSPSSNYKKFDDGDASVKDKAYGISAIYTEPINRVHIKYSYLGLSFTHTVIYN